MNKRVTIVMDSDNDKKIRTVQSDTIRKTNAAYSYSRCVNDILRSRK